MGSFYSGFGGHKSYLGHCNDGIIYRGSGNSTPIGRYENGNIYNQFKEHVGSYDGGSIYDACRRHIASYDGGIVYNKYLNVVFGKEQVGSYDGDSAAAAALVLLFLGGDDINERGKKTSQEDIGESNVVASGFWEAIFTFIFRLLILPFKLLFSLYMLLPFWARIICVIIINIVFHFAPFVLILFGIQITIPIIGSIPYWVILFIQKRKRKMSRKETKKYFRIWLKEGLRAYEELGKLTKSPIDN